MTTREAFLGDLRRPLERGNAGQGVDADVPLVQFASAVDGVATFAERFEALGGHVWRAAGPDEVDTAVVAAVAGRAPVVTGPGAMCARLSVGASRWPEDGRDAAAEAMVAVVEATAGVAATGSVVLDAARLQGRAVSLLPPVCVFLVDTRTVVGTPGDILRDTGRWWPDGLPSQVVLATGPSRSADIEMTLTVGIHGPGEVHVVLVEGNHP